MLVKELVEALLKEDQESLILKQNPPPSTTRKYDGIYDIHTDYNNVIVALVY